MTNLPQGIVVQVASEFSGIEIRPAELTRLVKTVCKRFGLSRATVSIGVVDDAKFCELNRRFLNRDSTSDCLSFNLSERTTPQSPPFYELVVNGQRALEQAKLRDLCPRAELALYVTHGLLHNFGFNDATEKQAEIMHRTEDEILQELGYGLVYNKPVKRVRRGPRRASDTPTSEQ